MCAFLNPLIPPLRRNGSLKSAQKLRSLMSRVLLDDVSDLVRLAKYRNMISPDTFHDKLRARLIDVRLCHFRRHRAIITPYHVYDLEVAHVRDICRRRIQGIERRKVQLLGPEVGFVGWQEIVEGLLGPVVYQISVCSHRTVVVVEVEDGRDAVDVLLGFWVLDLGDGGDITSKINKADDAAIDRGGG